MKVVIIFPKVSIYSLHVLQTMANAINDPPSGKVIVEYSEITGLFFLGGGVILDLNPGLHVCLLALYYLSHSAIPFFCGYF
jgi:hypothetical protein